MKRSINVKQGALCLGVIFLVLGAINATIQNVSGGTVCFAAGILVILLFHFDVKKFNVFGLAAELQEKLGEAEKILSQLRGIALPVSELAILFASKAGKNTERISKKELFQYVQTIENELIEIGTEENKIQKVKDGWYSITLIEMVEIICNEMINNVRHKDTEYIAEFERLNKIGQGNSDEFKTIISKHNFAMSEMSKIQEEFNTINSMRTSELKEISPYLREMLKEIESIDEDTKNKISLKLKDVWDDLDYFITEKKLRRPEAWFKV